MVRRAVDPTNPSLVKSLEKNRTKMDNCYIDLSYCYDTYKADTMTSENITEDVFNSVKDGVAKFQHNDKWLDELKESYFDLVDASDVKLETDAPEDTTNEEKVNLESEELLKRSRG